MSFKLFGEDDTEAINYSDNVTMTVSKNSSSADKISFFTAIKSLGKLNAFDSRLPASFALTIPREIRYNWNFNKAPIESLTAERTVGVYITSSGDESYVSSTNNSSTASHQILYNYSKGYLYRNDKAYDASITALFSSSTAQVVDCLRLITVRRDFYKSSIEPNSVRIEINLSNTSSTGVVTGAASAYTSALDLKNPVGQTAKSFVGALWNANHTMTSLETCTSAITIEAIIRPYNPSSVILWKRLSSSAYKGSEIYSQNAFMKLELTDSPDEKNNAFRFYIRASTSETDFSETFAKRDCQASGLFVPSEVGINMFDGNFHHIIVTWSTSGLTNNLVEGGAGSVLGYIDGYKLANREETDPRLGGADPANGPTIQANMFQQRYPIKTTNIEYIDQEDASPSGNNLYIGTSNYNHYGLDVDGDRGALSSSSSPNLAGLYDGQIQHIRIWNWRFSDGTTGVLHNINKAVSDSSTAGISFNNFSAATLTGNSVLSAHMVAWWNFNQLNTLTAYDLALRNSNSATLVGNATVRLYDHQDISTRRNVTNEDSNSGIEKTYLYVDIPEDNVINNGLNQGRIVRKSAGGALQRVGLIYYDLGLITLDSNDPNTRINYIYPASGSTGDFGFSVTGNNNAAINIERMVFNSIDSGSKLILDSIAEGEEFNYSQNITSFNETGTPVLDIPASYITTVALFNDEGDMLAIAKLSKPIRKDEASKLTATVVMDF